MGEMIAITDLRFVEAGWEDMRAGLLGYVSFLLNGALRIDGVTLRRTREGRLALSFPARRDRRGTEHPLMKPVSDEARVQIEQQVFEALGRSLACAKEGGLR